MNLTIQNLNSEIENKISSFFDVEYDLFLIGSRASGNFNESSDFDYILIFNKRKELLELSEISNKLNSKLNDTFRSKISIKIFDLKTFENLFFQDYFRFLEYKISHKPIINRNKIFDNKYVRLTQATLFNQLTNSIIIQYWWSIITISNKPDTKNSILRKFENRIKRNKELYNSKTNSNLNETEIVKSIIKNPFYSLIGELNNHNYRYFLTNYFDNFEHEMINKSNYYNKTLEKLLPNVKATIKHFKLLKYELA